MSVVTPEEDRVQMFVCRKVQGAAKCLSPNLNTNNGGERPPFWRCTACSRVVCPRCVNATIFFNKLRDPAKQQDIRDAVHDCK